MCAQLSSQVLDRHDRRQSPELGSADLLFGSTSLIPRFTEEASGGLAWKGVTDAPILGPRLPRSGGLPSFQNCRKEDPAARHSCASSAQLALSAPPLQIMASRA